MPNPIQRFSKGAVGGLDYADWNGVAQAVDEFNTLRPSLDGGGPLGVAIGLKQSLAIVLDVNLSTNPPQHSWIEAEWDTAQTKVVAKTGIVGNDPRSSFLSADQFGRPAFAIDGSAAAIGTPIWLNSIRANNGKELYIFVPYVPSFRPRFRIVSSTVINAAISPWQWLYQAMPQRWNNTNPLHWEDVPNATAVAMRNLYEEGNTTTTIRPGITVANLPTGVRPLPLDNTTRVIAENIPGSSLIECNHTNAWSTSCT